MHFKGCYESTSTKSTKERNGKKRTENEWSRKKTKIYDRRNFALCTYLWALADIVWRAGIWEKLFEKIQAAIFQLFSASFIRFFWHFIFRHHTDAVAFPPTLFDCFVFSVIIAMVHRVRNAHIMAMPYTLARRCLIGVHFFFAFVCQFSSLQFTCIYFFSILLNYVCEGFLFMPFVLTRSLTALLSVRFRGFEQRKNWAKIDCACIDSYIEESILILELVRDSIHFASHTNTNLSQKKLPITTSLLNHTLNRIKVEMRKSADGRTEGILNKEKRRRRPRLLIVTCFTN